MEINTTDLYGTFCNGFRKNNPCGAIVKYKQIIEVLSNLNLIINILIILLL